MLFWLILSSPDPLTQINDPCSNLNPQETHSLGWWNSQHSTPLWVSLKIWCQIPSVYHHCSSRKEQTLKVHEGSIDIVKYTLPTIEQWSKPMLSDYILDFYYPIYWGFSQTIMGNPISQPCILHCIPWILILSSFLWLKPSILRHTLNNYSAIKSLWLRAKPQFLLLKASLTFWNINWLPGWWLGHPFEKYERQLGWFYSQYMGK